MILNFLERLKKHIRAFSPHRRTKFERYLIPLLLVVFVLLAKLFLRTFVSDQTSYHLLTLIIILSAFYGGFRSGLFATFLIALLEATIFLPRNETFLGPYNILSTLILVIGGIYVSIISDLKYRAELQKDAFIGFASHELKHPLSTIQGYGQLILKKSKHRSIEVSGYAANIVKQTKHATALIDELLDVTKIEAGKLYFHMKRVPVYDLVKEAVAAARITADSHELVLKGRSTKKIYVDPLRLEQVLINLISNAVKYSPDAKKVVVSLENKEREVVISVQDFGRGISAKNLSRIFDRYFRERSASGDTVSGLGLGLYISSVIIKRHDGRIWAESEEGQGSKFYIALPTIS